MDIVQQKLSWGNTIEQPYFMADALISMFRPLRRWSRALYHRAAAHCRPPGMLPLAMIARDGVDVPYLDQWAPDIADVIIHAHDGRLTFSDLFAQHNEHRILVPKIVYAALDSVTHWDVRGELIVGFVLVCVTSLGVLVLCDQAARSSPDVAAPTSYYKSVLLWFACNLLIFTPVGWDTWLWGIGVANFMPIMWIVVGLLVANCSMSSWWRVGICLFIASAATFSSGNGILSWPLLGIPLLWSQTIAELRGKLWHAIVWVAGFAVNMTAYFFHYHKAHHQIDPYGAPLSAVGHYIVIFLGFPFSLGTALPVLDLATWVGGLFLFLFTAGVGLTIYAQWRRDVHLTRQLLPWIMVGLFAIGSAVMAAFARWLWNGPSH